MSITYTSQSEQSFWENDAEQYLSGIYRGIEKESLRIDSSGHISKLPHPKALGSTLTHQYITTDYSEALMEFITPASDDRAAPIRWLHDIHNEVYRNLQEESLWATSMPCVMGAESNIPLAYFGESNSGRMKTVYREGLGHRYGRFMQTIAGVHYNFSFANQLWTPLQQAAKSDLSLQDFRSARYMGVIRNFQRNSWIIPFFFGASPALCESFLQGRPNRLDTLVPGTRYGQFATSLRMSDLGYQNNVQSQLKVSTNCLNEYIENLEHAIRTVDPYYESIGVVENGHYKQLNANVLQIENEFYSNVRPKRTAASGERPTKALRNGGIEYIEVRALDINPFSSVGVTQQQLNFIDIFMLHSVMHCSPLITEREEAENKKNFARVVKGGRDRELYLWRNNRQQAVGDLARALFDEFYIAAAMLDKAYQTEDFSATLATLAEQIKNPELTLSGQVIAAIQQRGDGFFPFAMSLSEQYKAEFLAASVDPAKHKMFTAEAARSLAEQNEIEQNDDKTFAEFLADYFKD
ncbi:MAG: glutamate--cysteine ligase [Gammaproteobacteria bacterium]|nr:glutamate--cysteine ligase [Gammaproteobacteria bacterium]